MSESNVKHFEFLYNESEELADKKFAGTTTNDLLKSIKTILDDYAALDTSDLSKEIKTSLAGRHLGEILFLLTAISKRDDINVYAVLQEEVKLNGSE